MTIRAHEKGVIEIVVELYCQNFIISHEVDNINTKSTV